MSKMQKKCSPKLLKDIENWVASNLKLVKKTSSELLERQQTYHDQILEVYRSAFDYVIERSVRYCGLLNEINNAYNNSLRVRDERISQFITQDKAFGISVKKTQRDEKIKILLNENEVLREKNLKLSLEISNLKKDMGKLNDEKFGEYLTLMRERDARYTLYFENMGLQMKLKELDGSCQPVDAYGDPVVLRIALDRCREQLAVTQRNLERMTEEYAETVPRREHDALVSRHGDAAKGLDTLTVEHQALRESFKRIVASKKSVEEELSECRERCRELERAGTPRPHWDLCADFIGGGRDRWSQLASGLPSRDILRVLLKELGPAAESDHLEYFDGLGVDPAIPPYLRYEGRVRNLRLSRREVSVIINDIWLGKLEHGRGMSMQDYVTKYFEDRYQHAPVRAEWAYNLCAGAEQTLDEPQVKLFWGVLHHHLSEDIYWGHRLHWYTLRDHLRAHAKERETISIEEFERVAKATFPLKSEVDIKNLSDVVRKQLKLKLNNNEVNLDKLFQENEEGFDRVEVSRELFRQRQAAQDKYIREVAAALGARVTLDQLKRAFAIVDPAIDHIRMERNIRWAFSRPTGELSGSEALPLRSLAARLAAGDVARAGPRQPLGRRRAYK